MSGAAEKLKAIEAGCASWDDGERWADGLEIYIYDGQPPIHLLRNALPQIVAVVEAAEDFSGYDWHATQHLTAPLEGKRALDMEDVEKLKESRRKAQAALAALDEALGDVT